MYSPYPYVKNICQVLAYGQRNSPPLHNLSFNALHNPTNFIWTWMINIWKSNGLNHTLCTTFSLLPLSIMTSYTFFLIVHFILQIEWHWVGLNHTLWHHIFTAMTINNDITHFLIDCTSYPENWMALSWFMLLRS